MIGALRGTVFQTTTNPIIVFAGDVGYAVHVPDRCMSSLSPQSTTFLYIHTHVRDDALELFGFLTPQELRMFTFLLSVSGIGPKTALNIVDRGVSAIEHAIQDADVSFFTTIPRLGKKNAQKIIIELKSKMGGMDLSLTDDTSGTSDLVDALVGMGYDKTNVYTVIKSLSDEDSSLELKLRHAIQLLGKK